MAALAWLAWPWLPIAPDAVGLQRLVMLQMLVVMVVSFSPTMTAAVVADSGARGRLSDTVLAMVVLADLIILVLFSVSMQLARVVFDTGAADSVNVLARLAWELGGAVAFGVLIGVLFALYLRYIGREITLVLLAVCAVLSQVGTTQQLQPLLAAVAAGVVIENLAVAQGDALRAAVRRGAPPVLVVFFVAVGASLRLDALAAIGFSAIALSAVRIAFIRLGVGAGVRCLGHPRRRSARRPGPAWCPRPASPSASPPSSPGSSRAGATSCSCCVVASIAIHELVGPILFRRGLAQAGELDAPLARPLGRGLESRAVPPQPGGRWPDHGEGGDRRRRGGARRADARARRRLDRARRRPRGPAGRGRGRQGDGAAREPVVRAAAAVARGADLLRLLRRLRQRGPVAALSRGGRAAEVPQRGLGGVSGHQRPVRRRHSRRDRIVGRAGVHPGLSPGPGGAGVAQRCVRTRARRSSGTSRGRIRIACGSARGGASSSRGCWPTICSRSRSSAIGATS